MAKKEQEVQKNYSEYGYRGDEDLTIKGYVFRDLVQNIEKLLRKEIVEYYPEPTKLVNREYQEATKKQIKDGEAFKVLDLEGLLQNNEPEVFYTPLGKSLARLKFTLEAMHAENTDAGKATHISVLRKELEESQKPKLTKVENENESPKK